MWASVPWSIAPIRVPMKFSFSPVYSNEEIFGALGLLDHGFFKESDMNQV